MQSAAVGHSASGWTTENGVSYAKPIYMRTRNAPHPDVHPDTTFTYGNGALLYKPKLYLIFWGFGAAGDPNGMEPLLKKYAQSVGGTKYNAIYTQYTGTAGTIKNPKAQYGGFWNDDTNPIAAHPSDGQVAAESLAGVAHFGYDPNGSYVVVTAHLHSSSGFGSSFCAYHSATSYQSQLVSYTNLPYIPDAGQSCGSNIVTAPSDETGADEGVTIVEGHEYGESISDPNPPSGYYNGLYGEIGDICAWTDIQNDKYRKHIFTAQPMWSNADDACVHSYKKK